MRNLALAHRKVVLQRLTKRCADAGQKQASQTAHTLGLVIDAGSLPRWSRAIRRPPRMPAVHRDPFK